MEICCDLLLFSYLCKVLDNLKSNTTLLYLLWFAFIFVSLQSLRQLFMLNRNKFICCDLLLFSYLCKVLDNSILDRRIASVLWFAFIFVSLQSLRQPFILLSSLLSSCDLLLFSYLCKVLDNNTLNKWSMCNVVICFYFRIFAKS